MRQKAVTWFLLFSLSNTLFFAEVPGFNSLIPAAAVSSPDSGSSIGSLVELLVEYYLEQPDLASAEDFDDLPDHLNKGQLFEDFLLPQEPLLSRQSAFSPPAYGFLEEALFFRTTDVVSPPPKA